MPGLRAMSPVGGVWEKTDWCFSHTPMFLSLSSCLPSPLSKNEVNLKIRKGKDMTVRGYRCRGDGFRLGGISEPWRRLADWNVAVRRPGRWDSLSERRAHRMRSLWLSCGQGSRRGAWSQRGWTSTQREHRPLERLQQERELFE